MKKKLGLALVLTLAIVCGAGLLLFTPKQAYPPLGPSKEGRPLAVAHYLAAEEDEKIRLALQILAPGAGIEAIRIDNLVGPPSLWRSDGVYDEARPITVTRKGETLTDGSAKMDFGPLSQREEILELTLVDDGSFKNQQTDFRVTVFLADGRRSNCILKVFGFQPPPGSEEPSAHSEAATARDAIGRPGMFSWLKNIDDYLPSRKNDQDTSDRQAEMFSWLQGFDITDYLPSQKKDYQYSQDASERLGGIFSGLKNFDLADYLPSRAKVRDAQEDASDRTTGMFSGLEKIFRFGQGKTFTNSIGMEFVLIQPGKFTNTWTTKNDFDEDVLEHRIVTISRPFYLGKYEVTQEQWVAVMGAGSNTSRLKGRSNPVEMVSWDDVHKFIQILNQKEVGKKYRLPTDAEWEHAARAGSVTKWFFGNDPAALGRYAWIENNAQGSTQSVGQKKANPWGLHDIYGNIQEWVQDWHGGEYHGSEVTDPIGPASGSHRIIRGGSYYDSAENCQSSTRNYYSPDGRNFSIGFRLAFTPDQ